MASLPPLTPASSLRVYLICTASILSSAITDARDHKSIDRAHGDTARSRGVLVLASDGVCGPAPLPLAPFLSRAWPTSGLAFIGATLFMPQLPRLFNFFSSFPSHTPSPLCHEPVFSPNIRGWRDSLPWLDQGGPPSRLSLAAPKNMVVSSLLFSYLSAHWLNVFIIVQKGSLSFGTFPLWSALLSASVVSPSKYFRFQPG